MELKQIATAGTMESSDIMITLSPNKTGLEIKLQSNVEKQFGQQIRTMIESVLKQFEITNVTVDAVDKGALDCTIKARTIVAVYRGLGKEDYDWEEINKWIT
ncbi:citD protein [Latilactobacillus sakei subsp. carnosus DSM 15831]|uniref:citrate lyase acyl carrier protein n=1 Tax=Latilactobacillus sakei TaxID=1599 RepID=UPI00019CEE66|nr:citrate lyase acyl carrier protein [Latilactobacillus sakei]KRL70490.1 citD protein [Latilactobacillus sakei subsp. carnosus DSM 15831]GEP22120.1 citrate lyase acyl carrier protein [Latilactobacillus sakei subsp. carnosus]